MLDLFSLQGKVALCTGASRGLGKAMAIGLAKAGADIAVVGRQRDPDILDQIAAQGRRAVRPPAGTDDAEKARFITVTVTRNGGIGGHPVTLRCLTQGNGV